MRVEDRKTNIIRTAIRDFSMHGIQDVTLCEIAFDAGISISEMLEEYPRKDLLIDDVFRYIPGCIDIYEPSREDILELLTIESAYDILHRYSNVMHRNVDMMQNYISKLLCMEQYHSACARELVLEFYIQRPIEVLERTLDVLKAENCIPPCNSRAIAEMWQRTALVFEMKWLHGITDFEGYQAMNQFFISLILRGTTSMCTDVQNVDRLAGKEKGTGWDSGEEGGLKQKSLELFAAEGYEYVSLSDLADISNYSEGEILQHWTDKKGLLKEIAVDLSGGVLSKNISDLQNVVQSLTSDQLTAVMAGLQHPQQKRMTGLLCRILFQDQFFSDDIKELFLEFLQDACDAVSMLLDDFIRQKKICLCDSRGIAQALVYTLCSLTIAETVYPNAEKDDTITVRIQTASILLGLIRNGYLR